MISRASGAASVALVLAMLVGSPAAALDAGYDGVYGLVATTYGRGSFIVELTNDDQARVTTALKGLEKSAGYELILSKAPCGNANTPAKEVLRTTFDADASGASYRVEVVPWLWSFMAPVPRSARIRPMNGGHVVCVAASAFNRLDHSSASGTNAGMRYARFWAGNHRGLVILDQLDGSSGRLSWSISGLSAGTYRLTGAKVGCNSAVNAGSRLYQTTFGPDVNGIAVGRQSVAVEKDETIWIGSDRIKRVGGNQWGCSQGFVTDLIIDPL